MKILHLTDVHLTGDKSDLFCGNPHQRFDAAIRHINAHHADADFCVITGDLTHWGEDSAYGFLERALGKLAIPFHLLIGNHDNRKLFKQHFATLPVDASGFVQSVNKTHCGHFIFLDSHEPGTHAGRYCEERCRWLAHVLEDAGAEDCYLFMHHPPMPVHVEAADIIGQLDADALKAILMCHAHKIRHVFFGHCHLPLSGSFIGIPFSSIRSLNHPLWPDFASKTITIADVAPHYAVVFIADESVVIHHEEFLFAGKKWEGIGTSYEAWSKEADRDIARVS